MGHWQLSDGSCFGQQFCGRAGLPLVPSCSEARPTLQHMDPPKNQYIYIYYIYICNVQHPTLGIPPCFPQSSLLVSYFFWSNGAQIVGTENFRPGSRKHGFLQHLSNKRHQMVSATQLLSRRATSFDLRCVVDFPPPDLSKRQR